MIDKAPTTQIPHQVERLVSDLLNSNDHVHLRGNYRLRLDAIKEYIDTAIKRYDREVSMSKHFKTQKKGS